jgi:hypothetical protein
MNPHQPHQSRTEPDPGSGKPHYRHEDTRQTKTKPRFGKEQIPLEISLLRQYRHQPIRENRTLVQDSLERRKRAKITLFSSSGLTLVQKKGECERETSPPEDTSREYSSNCNTWMLETRLKRGGVPFGCREVF